MGRATSERLTGAGHHVAVFDRDAKGIRALADDGRDGRLTYHQLDVTDFPAVERAVNEVAAQPAGLDALVACAGIHDRAALSEGDTERWKDVLLVNVLGVATCVRACLPHLLQRDRADVIIWGSVSGLVPYTHESIYAASKAAVTHLADCLRLEVATTNVRVAVIHPGLVDTPMTRGNPAATAMLESFDPVLPENIARCAEFILDQPDNCSISELILRAANQAM
jgi:NADP-dependent 3-hydroxy acid dehydrogenase YdfG